VLQHGVLSLHVLTVFVDLFLATCGGLLAAGIWGMARSWIRIAFRRELLIFEVPRFVRTTIEEFRIDRIMTVSVGPHTRPHHIGTYLLLHLDGGEVKGVLETLNQSSGDLEIVAAALREALAFDPRFLQQNRELRDRYLERVNGEPMLLDAPAKYDVSRAPPAPGRWMRAMPAPDETSALVRATLPPAA
jgi:hypothetical protein